MGSDPSQTDRRINQYALVTYIPGQLGDFLNSLRQELVPGCIALSHVTLLPPRPLAGSEDGAARRIGSGIQQSHAFRLGIAEVQVFVESDVVYAEIGTGRESLLDMYHLLNGGELAFIEPFPFHPHVTLAQNFDRTQVAEKFELAQRRWAEYTGERSFLLDEVTFVQNTLDNRWIDLEWFRLPAIGDRASSKR